MQTVTALLSAIFLTAASLEGFRALQATGYRPVRGYCKVYLTWYFLSLVSVQVAAIVLDMLFSFGCYVNLGLYAVIALFWGLVRRKSPLKFTKRIWRMIAAELILLAVLCLTVNCSYWVWLLPVTVLAAWAICLPIDLSVNKRYVDKATAKLAASDIVVVAVTGSYGKTSVKDMLSALLDDCIAPQGSCNTPIGIAAFINKTDLSKAKYLVLEFGARCRGDISELCNLYPPACGIVSGVCAQHLSTFKSLQNVIATKRELVEHLPPNGFCVLNDCDDIAAGYTECGECTKILSHFQLRIDMQKVDFQGSQLAVTLRGKKYDVQLPQISQYAPATFAMCLQTALALGQTVEQTLKNATGIRQTPHRLQLMKGNGFYILDDSYNGSAVGVQSCCKTLSQFDCPKVAITQGLVECGKLRREMNVQCGKMLGSVCDAAVVLGKNKKYLAEGISCCDCKLLFASDLQEAVRVAIPFVKGGILLFQNDLPDSAVI